MKTKNRNNNKYLLKGGSNSSLTGDLSAGSNIPHLSPMQTGDASVKPLSDSGVTVGQVPFSTPEQIQCIINKGVPDDKAKIIALRANNDCDKALEIYQGGWKNHILTSADSWWPNKNSMSLAGGAKKQYTKKNKLKKKSKKSHRKKRKRRSKKRKSKRN